MKEEILLESSGFKYCKDGVPDDTLFTDTLFLHPFPAVLEWQVFFFLSFHLGLEYVCTTEWLGSDIR